MIIVPVPAFGLATILELFWTVVAATGTGFALFSLMDASADRKALDDNKIKNGRRLIASMSERRAKVDTFMLVLFLSAGIIASTTPSTVRGTTLVGFIISILLIIGVSAMVWSMFRDFVDRKKLLRKSPLTEEEQKGTEHAS